ncbi:MAG: hypothetical protein UU85_C0001G0130 [Candidatus Wolfebacteria bacterium GW2011_GWA2_42_10]|uniref:Prepilin-type N-terminal cleavage/methylation domain-containing protein n=2 Tax=Candidatus Wolfeibacteriota TaxID=1752735 RepID=A0A0G0XLD2_9BACT|nr:MAG: hypothetical protein UU38_C0003G0190 [Candidatus Wolfebacteria bacterium GW2011_GWB1_41_12]KKS25700.1 MAG: hypothetical protein UU85_C0001G0130 [Candidatus Wolfebacteria bacterium GW2011_GWA2_42_10]KKT56368.1 MAG: hypothetical protein UW50_C0002G0045 [Candidatus Wolfebacteria bacterium GW2011_GWA1_44_24]
MRIFKIKNGFTLVELIVSMGLFVVLTSIAVGGFVNVLRNQRIAVSLITVNDNTGLTLEQMAREIRTGYNFSKISNTELEFVNSYNFKVKYRLNGGAIEKGTEFFGTTSYQKITADNVLISVFNINVCGKNINGTTLGNCGKGGNLYFPRITLNLSVTSAEPDIKKLNIFTDIQTTISAR